MDLLEGSSRVVGILDKDPLSPYVFGLLMEYWSIHMDSSIASSKIKVCEKRKY